MISRHLQQQSTSLKSHQDSCDYHQHSRDVIEQIDAIDAIDTIDAIEGIEDKYNQEDRCYI